MNIKNKKKVLIILLIIAFIITIFNIGYAKYMETREIDVSAKIAKPIIILEEGNKVIIDDNNKEAEYKFKVKNFNNKEEFSDVQMNYTMEITGNKDEAIIYNLYKDGKEISLINNQTEKIKIGNQKKEEHSYVLKIKYDKTRNVKEEDVSEKLRILLHSEQII